MFHEFLDAASPAFIAGQPFDLPLGNSLAFFRNEVTVFGFANPFPLKHQYERFLCAPCGLRKRLRLFVLSKGHAIVILPI